MSFNPCLLIPIYNHGSSIRRTVEALVAYQLPIFIVDDGSDQATQGVLEQLARDFALVRLSRLPVNQGKGAAALAGFRAAFRAGFSHALQIDADGQHDTRDVPRFLAAGKTNPLAVVCGKPIYDASVPKGRLYGRYVTHFWVCIETLSRHVHDSMCGFRLYPLEATCALIDRVPIPARMDFDTAIFVRLAWEGLAFIDVPTQVIYPPGGLSHFDMWRDNLRISRMHTGLVIGMLLRLPKLLLRRWFTSESSRAHWSRFAERGSLWGLRTVFACYRLLGRRAANWLLLPIVGYFFLTGRQARTVSRDFLRRVKRARGETVTEPSWREVFRHLLSFGHSGLDKLAAWMGGVDSSNVVFPNRSEIEALAADKRGAVLIGSHLGNIEMMRALAAQYKLATVNAVLYTKHAQRFNSLLMQANGDFAINFIQISGFGPETAILLKEKIDRGELVVIVGDRTPPSESRQKRIALIDFLGEPAPFAQGPFILASLLDCPVYLFFSLREGEGYRIYLEHFAQRIVLPRRAREEHLLGYMKRYVERLEHYCLQAPEQWFNFYDFWRHDAALLSSQA